MIRPDEISQAILAFLALQSVYALILFPLIWAMVNCCRGRYPRWQHGLWLLIVLRLVLPPDMAMSWSASHLVRSLTSYALPRQYLAFTHEFPILQDHPKHLPHPVSDKFVTDGLDRSGGVTTIGSRWATLKSPISLKWLGLIITCVYLSGVTSLLMLFLRTRHRYWKIARQAKPSQHRAVLTIVRTWCKRLHIHRAIDVRSIDSDVPPYTIGLFRPIILLPEHLIGSAERAALESVLAHELVHVKRGDDLAICLQELVKIVYFFHPVVWFVIPRLTWTREAICDETVLFHGSLSPRTYGQQLIKAVRDRSFRKPLPRTLAVFTSAAGGMAFRLNHIRKEGTMKANPLIVYMTVLMVGLLLLPMAPVASSNQGKTADDSHVSPVQDTNSHQMANTILTQYILGCVSCQNPEEVGRIIWADLITADFQADDFSRLVSATDCDIVENIGDGQKVYVFYLLSSSRKGVYRPNFHFTMTQDRLELLFKSRNLSTYATDRATVNGRYEIEEGWRADIFNGIDDDRVKLAWGSSVWFWSGTQYLKAYTDYTIQEATDPSLLGTKRVWEKDVRSVYEAAHRK